MTTNTLLQTVQIILVSAEQSLSVLISHTDKSGMLAFSCTELWHLKESMSVFREIARTEYAREITAPFS